MVSRRNYFSIAIMMFLVLFMFQFSGVAKDALNDYETNEYEEATASKLTKKDSYSLEIVTDASLVEKDRSYVVYIGTPEEEIGNVVAWWCTYSKWQLVCYPSLADCSFPEDHQPEAVILDGANMTDFSGDSNILLSYAEAGVNLIFARLPEPEKIMGNDILQRDILGISNVLDLHTQLTGMHLFEGFLLGGEAIYEAANEEEEKRQDLDLVVPWYMTDYSSKTYLVGMMEDESIKNENLPAIIWRSRCRNAYTFCVNGDYLCNVEGMGILSAMMAEVRDYQVYPIVNAQSFVAANYPGLAKENDEEMQKRYSQSQGAVFREIIWPILVSVEDQISMELSCMMTPQFDYSDENEPESGLENYLKLIHEIHGEMGLSLDMVSDTPLEEKLARDTSLWKEEAGGYTLLAFYSSNPKKREEILKMPELTQMRTLLQRRSDGKVPMISYGNESVTLQCATSDGNEIFTYTDDLMNKSVETVLGYANVVADFSKVAYPKEDEDSWEKVAIRLTSTVCTFWKPFSKLEGTTVSEADERIRKFLSIDFKEKSTEEKTTVDIVGLEDQAWFIFRTHGQEIQKIQGGTYTELEKNVYLVSTKENRVTVTWKLKSQQDLFISMKDGE